LEGLVQEARKLDSRAMTLASGWVTLPRRSVALFPPPSTSSNVSPSTLASTGDQVTKAWHVATVFPPATHHPGLPWTIYVILRLHPERHELVNLVAREGWEQARAERELSRRFAYLPNAAG
jgi:hypothetical protein